MRFQKDSLLIDRLNQLPYREMDVMGTRKGSALMRQWVERFLDPNIMESFAGDADLVELALAEYMAVIKLSWIERQLLRIQEKVRSLKETMEEDSLTREGVMEKLKPLKSEFTRLQQQRWILKAQKEATHAKINEILPPIQTNEDFVPPKMEEASFDEDLFPAELDAEEEKNPSEDDLSDEIWDQRLENF